MADSYEHVPGQMEMPFTFGPERDQLPEAEEAAPAVLAAQQDFDHLLKELESLKQSNRDRFNGLARQGARPDPNGILLLRLNTLIDLVLSEHGRVMLELAFERGMVELLDNCFKELREIQLQQGAGNGGGLILPR